LKPQYLRALGLRFTDIRWTFAGLSQSGGMKKVVNSVFFIMPGSCDFILQTVLNHSAKPIRFRIRNIRE